MTSTQTPLTVVAGACKPLIYFAGSIFLAAVKPPIGTDPKEEVEAGIEGTAEFH